MPRRFKWLSGLLISALLSVVMTGVGCATSPQDSSASTAEWFKESSSDMKNRAPVSFSVPQSAATGTQIDPLQMRSEADYHFTLAESYSLEGNGPRAIEEYKLTLVYDPQSSLVRLRLAQEYVKQGLISESMEQTKIALELDPNMTDAHLLLGGLYSALRMYSEALMTYHRILLIDPDNVEAPMFIGALYAEQKRYAEAITQFEALAKNKSNHTPHVAWYYAGRVHLESENAEGAAKAEKAFRRALALKPEFIDAALALGQMYESTKQKGKAKALYRDYQEKHGPDASVADMLSRLHFEDEEYDKAYQQLEIIEARESDNLNVKVKIAFILIEKKQFQDAIVKLEEILARAPQASLSEKIRFYLGAVYEEIKDYKAAIGQFKKIPPGGAFYAEAVIHSAYLNKLLGFYDEAVKVIEEGIQNQPDHPQFYALYASFLEDLKAYTKGIDMLEAAVRKFPEQAQLHFFLGSMQDRIGKTEQTISSMQRVLQIDENHIQALNYLAYTYAEQSKNLDDAERMVRRALELQPGDGYIMDTLGWVLFKKGRLSDAVKMLEAAYKSQPKESVIAEHLGDVYYLLQIPEKAKRMYQRAVEIETNQENIRKIRQKIVSIEQQQEAASLPKAFRNPANQQGSQ